MLISEWDGLTSKVGFAVVAAFFGAVARSRYWFYPDDLKTETGGRDERAGTFNYRRCVTEISASIALGMIAAGLGEYLHCPPIVMGGLAAALGLVGAACAGEVVEAAFRNLAKLVGGKLK